MTSVKCSQCGLINLSTSEFCKRCKASLALEPESTSSFVSPPAPEYPVIDDEQPSRWRLSPLRILILVLVVVFAVWYQFSRSDAARDAQAQKDKEFYQKRAEEDNLRHLGDRR